MKYMIALVLALLVVAVACSKAPEAPAPTPPAPAPVPEPTPAPVVEDEMDKGPDQAAAATDEVKEINAGTDKFFGEKIGDKVITSADVLCNAEARKITFTFRNLDPDEMTWQLDGQVPLINTEKLAPIEMLFNQRQFNKRPYFGQDGERLFGPNEKFSDNCGGVTELAPGEEVTCTLQPVPLRGETDLGGANQLLINVPGSKGDGSIRFSC